MASMNIELINITPENIDQYPPVCFLNPKHEAYGMKRDWFLDRFKEGMKIKQLYVDGSKKANGFVEYVPGEYAWRAVDAKGYLFIHCLWVTPNKLMNQGIGTQLVEACLEDAKVEGKAGVAVITSEGSFMASKALFEKNGFESVAEVKPSFNLVYDGKLLADHYISATRFRNILKKNLDR